MVERSRNLNMKGHIDQGFGGKVQGLKYSYSMKSHIDPHYGRKVQETRVERSRGLMEKSRDLNMKGHIDPG